MLPGIAIVQLGNHSFEVIILNSSYPDLISLIAQNRDAMAFFKTLPDHIKCELSKNAERIVTIEDLKQNAAVLQKEAERH